MQLICTSLLSYSFTGEFGVVYKAQYTEPEGDIGYKTSTVAVKTLKGITVTLTIFHVCLSSGPGLLMLSSHRFL